jgi:pyridoxamine 5'-phosphate oxidase family protein
MTFTPAELEYLDAQRLGRLATIGPDGVLMNNPVGYFVDAGQGVIDIGGIFMDTSRKYANVVDNGKVSLVVDDLVTVDPWRVRGMEIRGRGEALTLEEPLRPHQRPQIIRIHPRRILTWGVEPGPMKMLARNVD